MPVNDIRVFAQSSVLSDGRHRLVFRYQLVPREPCILRVSLARLVCELLLKSPSARQPPGYIYNHFFETPDEKEIYERVYLSTPSDEITVRALPEAGRTARFADIVGPCKLTTSIAPPRLIVGQSALLTVHLGDLDLARHIESLPAAAFDGLRHLRRARAAVGASRLRPWYHALVQAFARNAKLRKRTVDKSGLRNRPRRNDPRD